MKQLLSVLFIAVLFTGFINAQSQGVSIGGNIALPMGGFGDLANFGFGGTATYERSFTPNIVGEVYAGYLKMGGKDATSYTGDLASYSYSMIPIMAGAKYFFQPGKGFYANALLGLHIVSFNVSFSDPQAQAIYDAYAPSTSSTNFSLGVGAGYEMPMGKNALDLSAHFMIVSDANYIGARVAYKFSLK